MIKNNKKIISIIFLVLFSLVNAVNVFADSTTPQPYDKEEFPQTLKDLRRFEIITLGAMPFVTLDVTLAYSGYKSVTTGAPFNPFGSSNYSQDEQFKIILTSLGISTGVGLFDYVYHIIQRNVKLNKNRKNTTSYINVIPISEDPDAVKIDLENNSDYEFQEDNSSILEEDSTEDVQLEVIE